MASHSAARKLVNVSVISISQLITDKIDSPEMKNKKGLFIINETESDQNVGQKIYIKIFVFRRQACQSITGFLDSGADVSLIQESFVKKLLNNDEIEKYRDPNIQYDLTSFSNDKIAIKYGITLSIGFGIFQKSMPFRFNVITDLIGAPKVLLGADFMRRSCMSISYTGDVEHPTPEIKCVKPQVGLVRSFYVSDRELYSCTAKISLEAYEKKTFKFYLNPASQVLPVDHILISGGNPEQNIYITSSRSKVKYDSIK